MVKEIPETWILLTCYWVDLLYSINSDKWPQQTQTLTHSFEMNGRFAFIGKKYNSLEISIFDFCVSINLVSSKPLLKKKRKGLEPVEEVIDPFP